MVKCKCKCKCKYKYVLPTLRVRMRANEGKKMLLAYVLLSEAISRPVIIEICNVIDRVAKSMLTRRTAGTTWQTMQAATRV